MFEMNHRQHVCYDPKPRFDNGANRMPVIDERGKRVLTEREVRAAQTGDTIRISESALITPLASDLARERGITLERLASRAATRFKIAVGADHGGFEMKENLKRLLAELGHEFHDFGTHSDDPVDYPDYAHVVARAVASGTCDLGIMIDGAGIGSCIAANKVPGIRAAMCYDEVTARNSREHNGANLLTLGGKLLPLDRMPAIVRSWLSASLTEDRHRRRVAKIDSIEQSYDKDKR
jgi:ribose 5-phosphate isomerase B